MDHIISTPSRKRWWHDGYNILIFLIFLLGLGLRFYHLSFRPLHHDESLHGMYSLYALENPLRSFYKYNPLLHGPLLYNVLPWSLKYLGLSKFSIRFPAALIGSLFIFFPTLFRGKLSKVTILFFSFFIAVGPTFVFWSRYMRHDTFVFASLFLLLFSILKLNGFSKGIGIGLALAIHFSTKENFFVHLALILGLVFYDQLYKIYSKSTVPSLLNDILGYIRSYPLITFLSVIIFFTVSAFLYSSGFVYMDGFWDGLYRKSISYWIHQHDIERISGPFITPFFINSMYVTWWIPAVVIHLLFFYKGRSNLTRILFLFTFLPGLIIWGAGLDYKHWAFGSDILKLKILPDYFIFFPLLFHSIVGTTTYLTQQNKKLAYSFYFFTASLFTYSYVGEKVPWLALYPLIAGLTFFAFEFQRLFNKPISITLLFIIPKLIFNMYWCNFTHSTDPYNLLTQVHTEEEFEKTMFKIRTEMDSLEPGHGGRFLAKDGHTWPTTWYLHGRPEYFFKYRKAALPVFKYILTEWNDHEADKIFKETHIKEKLPYRGWWVPDFDRVTFKDIYSYWLEFKPWSKSGGNHLALFKKVKKTTPSHSNNTEYSSSPSSSSE